LTLPSPAHLAPAYELDAEPSADDTAILQKLMMIGSRQERLRFLG
jgi:hypothetical protein